MRCAFCGLQAAAYSKTQLLEVQVSALEGNLDASQRLLQVGIICIKHKG